MEPPHPPETAPPEAAESVVEMIDRASRRVAAALVIAAALLGVALYSRPGPPRYQAVATPNGVVRLDARKGTMIQCDGQRCVNLHRLGGHIEDELGAHIPQLAAPPTPAGRPASEAPTPPATPAPAKP
jgi:hypothetical protein